MNLVRFWTRNTSAALPRRPRRRGPRFVADINYRSIALGLLYANNMGLFFAGLCYRAWNIDFSSSNAPLGLLHITLLTGNCSCNWGTCITRRPRAHHRVNPYPGARRQNETEMFSDQDETSPSTAAVSAPSVACSMLAVQQQKRLCRQFVDVSAAQRGCHMMKRAGIVPGK